MTKLVSPSAVRPPLSHTLPTPSEIARRKILVVDDHEDVRVTLRELLEACGYDVVSSRDRREALAAYQRETPHLVLSDLDMPEADAGFGLLGDLRQINPNVLLIIVTGRLGPDHVEYVKGMGAVDLLSKPFSFRELKASVSSAFESSPFALQDPLLGSLMP